VIDELTDFPGDRIRELRQALKISQRLLSANARVDQADISRLEHGAEVRWSTLRRLFAALGYRVVLEEFDEEETDNYYQDMNAQRERRMEAGRERRWG
jgi:transcriptional regulator with XRE-family HTH domain